MYFVGGDKGSTEKSIDFLATEELPKNSSIKPDEHKGSSQEISIVKKSARKENLPEISIKNLRKALPTKNSLKNLSNHEVHELPLSVAEFGEELIKIKGMISGHPRKYIYLHPFYKECIADPDAYLPIRSMCLDHLLYAQKLLKNTDQDLQAFPKDVVDMYLEVNGLFTHTES
jgi:hypothetical protein